MPVGDPGQHARRFRHPNGSNGLCLWAESTILAAFLLAGFRPDGARPAVRRLHGRASGVNGSSEAPTRAKRYPLDRGRTAATTMMAPRPINTNGQTRSQSTWSQTLAKPTIPTRTRKAPMTMAV